MPPQSPSPAPPPITPGSNPYDFITNPSKPPKKSLLPGGNSTGTRILVVAVGLLLLIIIGGIFMSILGSANKGQVEDLVLAAQQQEELRRVSEIGTKDARGSTAKNLATIALLTLESDQRTLKPIVDKAKKLNNKQLAEGKDNETTETLTQAKQANRFDDVFMELMRRKMAEYQTTLKRVHDDTSNQKDKAVLAEQYRNIGLLIGEE